jgi:hypothetical protein
MHVVDAGLGHGGNDFAGPRVVHLDHTLALQLLAADAQAFAQRGIDDAGVGAGHGRVPFSA